MDIGSRRELFVDRHLIENLGGATLLLHKPAHREVVREMCGRMWRFAKAENDSAINPYITVGLAPFGPAEAFT
ncbi:MAG: hypothetical protein ACOC8E_03890 [Planctomycetota bacterium]